MEDNITAFITLSRRTRGALMVFCALLLFIAGLLLLFAPASAQDFQSRIRTSDFPGGANGWIMGAHSLDPGSLAGNSFGPAHFPGGAFLRCPHVDDC